MIQVPAWAGDSEPERDSESPPTPRATRNVLRPGPDARGVGAWVSDLLEFDLEVALFYILLVTNEFGGPVRVVPTELPPKWQNQISVKY